MGHSLVPLLQAYLFVCFVCCVYGCMLRCPSQDVCVCVCVCVCLFQCVCVEHTPRKRMHTHTPACTHILCTHTAHTDTHIRAQRIQILVLHGYFSNFHVYVNIFCFIYSCIYMYTCIYVYILDNSWLFSSQCVFHNTFHPYKKAMLHIWMAYLIYHTAYMFHLPL